METSKSNRLCLAFYYVVLVTSLFVIPCKPAAASDAPQPLPCPTGCKCYKQNYESHGDVNRIVCSNLGFTTVPDLKLLTGSTIPNYLALDQNEIGNISKSDFPPGLKIAVLDLSGNRDINMAEDAFLNLGYSLKKLTVEAVDLVYDKTLAMFDSLFSLEELSLNQNNKHPYTKGAVQNVQVSLFQGEVAKNLKSLKLAYCGMRTLSDDSLKSLISLEELDISNNWFTSIPPAIKHLTNLRFVEFFYSNIKSLKDNDFLGLPNLEIVDLSSNVQLKTISDNAFSGCEDSLQQLNIQRCSLTEIPTEALRNLKKLTFLDISENQNSFVNVKSSPLAGKYKLKELRISANNLTFDPDIFKGQEDSIVDLSIPRMGLTTVPLLALQKLTKLQRLSLDYNQITALPEGAFSGITATSILLNNNPLSKIEPGAFNGLPPKLVISLRRTEMADIEFLLDYPDSAIHTVNLEHAKLECRCSMKSAINVTQTIHVYGSCSKGDQTLHITSSRLGGILNQACKEERGNAGNNLLPPIFVLVVSLACVIKFLTQI